MMGVCHLPRHDQVLADEEGCVRSKGVMTRNIGMKKRQTSRMRGWKVQSGKETFGQHLASKRASDGKVRCLGAYKVALWLPCVASSAPLAGNSGSRGFGEDVSIYRLLYYSVKGFKKTKV